jgi:hypothetical protein
MEKRMIRSWEKFQAWLSSPERVLAAQASVEGEPERESEKIYDARSEFLR